MIKRLIFLVSVLLRVAFITLWERKILSYAQARKGPNLVGSLGLLQPFRDGLKLLTKEKTHWGGNSLILYLSPLCFFFLNFMAWVSLPLSGLQSRRRLLLILVLRSLGGVFIFLAGWNGSRSYSFMGGVRSSAQMISYEVVLSFFFLTGWRMYFSFSFSSSKSYSGRSLRIYFLGALFFFSLWILTLLAETNRAPFDLSEGESELVRGFNTEYSSFPFTFLFLGEYSFIVLFSFLSSFIFFDSWLIGSFFCFLFLWIRACFPRKRYDFLINDMWIFLFPFILYFLQLQMVALFI